MVSNQYEFVQGIKEIMEVHNRANCMPWGLENCTFDISVSSGYAHVRDEIK